MDETDTPQNRSNDDAESKSSDENSFLGKMKFGVSKILPNSLSKWLSPKVDVSSARRRRHEEMDSDDENANRNSSPLASVSDERYQTTPQLGAPPPNKKKKIFTDFLGRNTAHDLYSPSTTSLIGERTNIVSSTLIEDVPHRSNNQFNRYLPLENGQHADEITRDNASNYPDEASSSQSREKPINPFAITNDSSVVNFSAHLQRAKSLFTNRSYISPRLKNYRMRNPRSSLYRSTSSLCDNNSVSSNASSAMSSPFYNGQTTFGGASATSRRLGTPLNQDSQMHHRPKVPTNLVTSRSTSSLNNIGGSASMSNTAKRILDVMSKYNTPLTEVRRISNALPSIAEASALNKRKSILDSDTTNNDMNDKTKRSLIKPNTPYNRPFGRNSVESVLTTELHVPSMPELLQLKKFAANTMRIRDIASSSDSVLNKPAAKVNQFKLTNTITHRTDGDLDASNNNKSINNKIDSISNMANEANKQHKNKIRTNLNKRRMGKNVDNDKMPEPVDLPNIPLMMDKTTEPFKLQNTEQKTTNSPDNGLQIPFKFKTSNTSVFVNTKEKQTNGNSSEINKPIFNMSLSKAPTFLAQTNSFSARTNSSCVDSPTNPQIGKQNNSKSSAAAVPSTTTTTTAAAGYRFTEPIIINQSTKSIETSQSNKFGRQSDFSFSEPMFVTDKPGNASQTIQKINKIPSDSGIASQDTTLRSPASKFNAANSTSSSSSTNNNMFSTGKSVSSLSTAVKDDDTFKSLVAKQKQGKWSCKDCFASNDASVNKCMCCGAANAPTQPPAATEDSFKSIVAKQKQAKWACNDCMAPNDQAQNKCVCCGAANPSATGSSTVNKKAELPKPSFSFGAFPSATASSATVATSQPIDSEFKKIVDKQKSSWQCSACLSRNDMSKSKCACCDQSRDVTKGATTSEAAPAKSGFSFGSNITAPKGTFSFGAIPSTATSVAPTFSFGNAATKTNTQASFSFGSTKNDAPTSTSTLSTTNSGKPTDDDQSKESTTQKTSSSAQFSFGNPTVLPSTSKTETTSKPAAPVASDNIFKSIVDKQKKSTWECSTCMTKNAMDKEKCACCETPKDGSVAKDSAKKEFGLSSSPKFSFGAPASSTFSFGSKPATENKPTFQFGSPTSGKTTVAAEPTAPATSVVSSTTSSTTTAAPAFGSGTQTSMFAFSTSKPSNELSTAQTVASTVAPATTLTSMPSSGFQFSFGSSSTSAVSSQEVSKDVTDTGLTSKINTNATANDKGITVLGNVLVKPASNGPNEMPKPTFAFGQNLNNQPDGDPVTKAKKRSNTDLNEGIVSPKLPAPSSAPFIFGQSQNTNNTFGAIVSSPATSTTQETSAPKPTFSFGMSKPSTNAFPTAQPAFSSTPFGFGSGSTATTTAPSIFGAATPASAINTPSQPIFGSNVFSSTTSSLPTLGGFKAGPTFGSTAPVFGAPSPNIEAQAQAQATQSPAPGIFQFGANNTNVSAPLSSGEQPKTGGFNFSLNTAPTFNFSEQAPQQSNVPFQFGSASDASPNIFSVPPTTATATATQIQQRRKLRPVRRVNRP